MAEPCIPYPYPTRDCMAEPCSWQARAAHHAAACSGYSSQMRASCCSPAWWHPGRHTCAPRSAPACAPPAPVALASDQGASAPRKQRRSKPPVLHARRLGAAAARRGARASRSKLQGSRVRPSLANTQLAPPRAQPRPPPLSGPHTHLDGCGGRGCSRSWPLGLAACARCGRFAPSLHPRPLCARTGIERRRRRVYAGPVSRATRRAGRMPASLCQARPMRRLRCARARRAPARAPPHGVQQSAAARRALRRPPCEHHLRRLPTSLALCSRGALSASCALPRRLSFRLRAQPRRAPWLRHPRPGVMQCPRLWQGGRIHQPGPWQAVVLSAACGMHRRARKSCQDPQQARSAADRHTGAVRAARAHMTSLNKARPPAALPTV